MNKQTIFNLLLYISLFFLIFFLIRFDYINIKNIHFNYLLLIVSVIILWLAVLVNCYCWGAYLKINGVEITNSEALVSYGLSILGKYIPGKIWVIFGRAVYVSNLGYSLTKISFISLKTQILMIIGGLIVSIVPLLITKGFEKIVIFGGLILIILMLLTFNKKIHNFGVSFISKIFKRDFTFPFLDWITTLKITPYILLYWLLLMLGFYFFVRSFGYNVSFSIGLVFPLSVVLGILAIIFPGGLGVREGVLTSLLVSQGLNLSNSISISFVSRLWFLSAELFLFIFSFVINKFYIKKVKNKI